MVGSVNSLSSDFSAQSLGSVSQQQGQQAQEVARQDLEPQDSVEISSDAVALESSGSADTGRAPGPPLRPPQDAANNFLTDATA